MQPKRFLVTYLILAGMTFWSGCESQEGRTKLPDLTDSTPKSTESIGLMACTVDTDCSAGITIFFSSAMIADASKTFCTNNAANSDATGAGFCAYPKQPSTVTLDPPWKNGHVLFYNGPISQTNSEQFSYSEAVAPLAAKNIPNAPKEYIDEMYFGDPVYALTYATNSIAPGLKMDPFLTALVPRSIQAQYITSGFHEIGPLTTDGSAGNQYQLINVKLSGIYNTQQSNLGEAIFFPGSNKHMVYQTCICATNTVGNAVIPADALDPSGACTGESNPGSSDSTPLYWEPIQCVTGLGTNLPVPAVAPGAPKGTAYTKLSNWTQNSQLIADYQGPVGFYTANDPALSPAFIPFTLKEPLGNNIPNPMKKMCTTHADCTDSFDFQFLDNSGPLHNSATYEGIPDPFCDRNWNANQTSFEDWGFCRNLTSSTDYTVGSDGYCPEGYDFDISDVAYCLYVGANNNSIPVPAKDGSKSTTTTRCLLDVSYDPPPDVTSDCSKDEYKYSPTCLVYNFAHSGYDQGKWLISSFYKSKTDETLLLDPTSTAQQCEVEPAAGSGDSPTPSAGPCFLALPTCSLNCSQYATKEACEVPVTRVMSDLNNTDFQQFFNGGSLTSNPNCSEKSACFWSEINGCRGSKLSVSFTAPVQGPPVVPSMINFQDYYSSESVHAFTAFAGPGKKTNTVAGPDANGELADVAPCGNVPTPSFMQCTPSKLVQRLNAMNDIYVEQHPTMTCTSCGSGDSDGCGTQSSDTSYGSGVGNNFGIKNCNAGSWGPRLSKYDSGTSATDNYPSSYCAGVMGYDNGVCLGEVDIASGIGKQQSGYCALQCLTDSECPGSGWMCMPIFPPDTGNYNYSSLGVGKRPLKTCQPACGQWPNSSCQQTTFSQVACVDTGGGNVSRYAGKTPAKAPGDLPCTFVPGGSTCSPIWANGEPIEKPELCIETGQLIDNCNFLLDGTKQTVDNFGWPTNTANAGETANVSTRFLYPQLNLFGNATSCSGTDVTGGDCDLGSDGYCADPSD